MIFNQPWHINSSHPPIHRLMVLIFASSLLLLVPVAWGHFFEITRAFPENLRLLVSTDFEERKLQAYGTHELLGYGYLRKIVDPIPEEDLFPLTRYRHYTQDVHLFFPGHRYRIDDRILVGIDLPPQDLRPHLIGRALKFQDRLVGNRRLTTWQFVTAYDYDDLTGLLLEFMPPPIPSQNLRITLRHSPRNPQILGQWIFRHITGGPTTEIKLDPPVRHFSFSRGALAFIVEIEQEVEAGLPPPAIAELGIIAIKVNLKNYETLHQEEQCFTALRKDFLQQIETQGPDSWRRYLEYLRNA